MCSLQMCSQQNDGRSRQNAKALALISGGLDSALAIYLIKRQGIEVTALHFTAFFTPPHPEKPDSPVMMTARHLGVPVIFRRRGLDFLETCRNPKYGYGKNANPCIDCRIYSFRKAREVMEEIGASFLVTGEVVGQRPMSQRRMAMDQIDKDSGCKGIVVRPLSAKLLEPTIPEAQGLVDRDLLLDIAGRGRKIQLALAKEIGLTGYQTPAGGCLLTDKNYSKKFVDLLKDKDDVSLEELELLRIGRHFRLRPGVKLIVGRDESENMLLGKSSGLGSLFQPTEFPGPAVLVVGPLNDGDEEIISGVIMRYTKPANRRDRIVYLDSKGAVRSVPASAPARDDWLAERAL